MAKTTILIADGYVTTWRHGTYSSYSRGCRCDRCREAKRVRTAENRAARAGTLPPDDPRHGTRNGWDHYGCRCDRCTDTHRRLFLEYRAALSPEARRALNAGMAERRRAQRAEARTT